MSAAVEEYVQTSDSLAGKYLTFRLGREEYGLEILTVREINGMMKITDVPKTPEFVKGVMNLRDTTVMTVRQTRQLRQLLHQHVLDQQRVVSIVVTTEVAFDHVTHRGQLF